VVTLGAQTPAAPGAQPPQGPLSPPPARVQDPGNAAYDDPVWTLRRRVVRDVAIERMDARGQLTPMPPETADGVRRGLLTRQGAPFEPMQASIDCANLWNERRLRVNVRVREADADGIQVVFVVEDEIRSFVGVEFRGLESLQRQTVDSLLGIDAERPVSASEAEAMRKVLLARYGRDGFPFASVRQGSVPVEVASAAAGAGIEQRLVFHVDEGPQVTIRDVTVHGNVSFAAEAHLGLFGTADYLLRDSQILSDPSWGFTRGSVYSREILEEDLDRLRLFYRSRGFLDATVDLADARFSADRTEVDIAFVVVEGPRYRIKSVRLQHVDEQRRPLTVPPRYAAAEIEGELKVRPGEFYDHERLQRDWLAIQEFYGRRGHAARSFPGMSQVRDASIVFWPPEETYGTEPEVEIVFQVLEGSPKRLRDVLIRGNRSTRDHVIRRRVRVQPGERIDMLEVRRSLRQIEQTRFFLDPVSMAGPRVQLEPVPPSAGQPDATDLVDLGIDVEDGDTGELRWGVGITTGQGTQASMTFNKRNFDLWRPPSSANPVTIISEIIDQKAFHGGGQNLNMLLAPGTRYSQFAVTWTEPDIFGLHQDTYELRVSGQRRIRRLAVDGFTSDVLAGEIGLSRNFTEEFNVGLSLREESVDIDRVEPNATFLAFDAEGRTELRGTRLSARYRDYDDFRRPTSGGEIGLSYEMIGGFLGGEESLHKTILQGHLYVPLFENEAGHRTVLHFEQLFGVASAFGGSDDVFVLERFYMGGANLRGFDFRRAGPNQFGRPVGGEATWTGTAEIYFPLVATRLEREVRDRELLRGVIFTDVGLLGLGIDDPTFNQLRASSGIGIRIEVPVLEVPIALDLGWPWLYEETDDRRQFFFSISR
jgi:outer membrane protein insertion porin family